MQIERSELVKEVDTILYNNRKDYQIPGFNGRVLSTTSDIEPKLLPICYNVSKILRANLPFETKLVVTRVGHRYLITDKWYIEPTIGQFIESHGRVFIGTEQELKNLILRARLINTKYLNNPEAAMEIIWGLV